VFGVNPVRQGSLNLSVVYETVTSAGSEPLWLLNSTFLQIGKVSVPTSRFWTFCISGIGHESCIETESRAVKSLLFSVPSQGKYSIRGSNGGLIGFFETEAGVCSFDVFSNFSFIPEAHFVPERRSSLTPMASFAVPSSANLHSRTSEAAPSTSKASPPTSEAGPRTSEGLSSGVIAGIVVGCVVVMGAIIAVVIFVTKKAKYHTGVPKVVGPTDSLFSSQISQSVTSYISGEN
jgi:hypothetical protein